MDDRGKIICEQQDLSLKFDFWLSGKNIILEYDNYITS